MKKGQKGNNFIRNQLENKQTREIIINKATARAKVSIVIDILNKFVLDIQIAKHKTSEINLSKIHQ